MDENNSYDARLGLSIKLLLDVMRIVLTDLTDHDVRPKRTGKSQLVVGGPLEMHEPDLRPLRSENGGGHQQMLPRAGQRG